MKRSQDRELSIWPSPTTLHRFHLQQVARPEQLTHTQPDRVIDDYWPSLSWWERVSMNTHTLANGISSETLSCLAPNSCPFGSASLPIQLSFFQPFLIYSTPRLESITKTCSSAGLTHFSSNELIYVFANVSVLMTQTQTLDLWLNAIRVWAGDTKCLRGRRCTQACFWACMCWSFETNEASLQASPTSKHTETLQDWCIWWICSAASPVDRHTGSLALTPNNEYSQQVCCYHNRVLHSFPFAKPLSFLSEDSYFFLCSESALRRQTVQVKYT